MKKVSLIIPIYNMEKYLDRCLSTVINQTYKNIEIILVNDGSKDSSLEMCKHYQEQDERIIVIDKENGGLSSARNEGLKYVTGDYIMYIDPDDWIDKIAVEKCMQIVTKNDNIDIVVFPYIKEFINNSIKTSFFESDGLFTEKTLEKKIYRRFFGLYEEELRFPDRIDVLSSAWGKLYRSDVIKGIEFVDTKIIGTEDAWYNINVFAKVKKAYYVDNIYYHYFKDNNTSLTKTYKKDLFEKWSTLYSYMKENIKKEKLPVDFEIALDNRIILNLLTLSLNIVNSNLSFISKYKNLKKLLNQELYVETFKKFSLKYFDLKWKVYYFSCKNKLTFIVMFMTMVAEKIKRYRK